MAPWTRDYHLYKWEDIPPFLQYNKFIRTGYRKDLTVRQTVCSVLHWHNESMNVWTHLMPVLVFPLMYYSGLDEPRTAFEHFMWICQCLSVVVCMSLSVCYHSAMCMTPCTVFSYQSWLDLDLRGIVFAYLVSSLRRIYFSLYCHPTLRAIALLSLLAAAGEVVAVWATGFVKRSAASRVIAFGALMTLVNVSTVFTWVVGDGSARGRTLHLLSVIFQVLGGMINASRMPERFFESRFTDYVINSHVIMHVLAVIGVTCTWYGCNADFDLAVADECAAFLS